MSSIEEGCMSSPQNTKSVSWGEGTAEYLRTYAAIHHRPATRKLGRITLETFGAFLAQRIGPEASLGVVSLTDLEHYQAWCLERGLKTATVNKHARIVRAFLRWASFRGYVRENPTKGLRLIKEHDREDPRVLSKVEVETLRRHLDSQRDEMLRDIFRLGLNTGGRLGEILWLQIFDLDATGDLHFRSSIEHRTKGGDSRVVPANDSVREIFERRATMASRWLFPAGRSKRPYDVSTISKRFTRAAGEAGLEGVTFHSLRRTFATEMANRLRPAQLMKLMGHKHIEVTMKYYVNLDKLDRSAVPVLV